MQDAHLIDISGMLMIYWDVHIEFILIYGYIYIIIII